MFKPTKLLEALGMKAFIPPQKPRMTSKTPEQQRADYYAAEAKRQRRQIRNLKNAKMIDTEKEYL